MSAITESPTKNIREKLERFHLENAARSKNGSGDEIRVSKNHLQIPLLLVNDNFKTSDADESKDEREWDEQDGTVIHKTLEGDVSMADFMKVKLRVEGANNAKPKTVTEIDDNIKRSENLQPLKPKLASDENDHNSSFNEANMTWELLKKKYNIPNKDTYAIDESMIFASESSEAPNSRDTEFKSPNFNKSVFSFQETPKIKFSGTTLNTEKVTSFQGPHFIDSPLEAARLLRPTLKTSDPKGPIDFKVPLKLITPSDLSMVFDENKGKWIYKNLPDTKNETETNYKNTPCEITSITNIDVSFSESKKAMISALTSIIPPNTDWDTVEHIDLSNQKLLSLIGLSEFLPELNKVTATANKLTNFDGIPLETKELNLSKNVICDHLTSISNFKYLISLNLRNNKITRMDFFKKLPNLKNLDLSNNKIKKLVGLRYIESLNVSGNHLTGTVNLEETEFPYLSDLDLSNNRIRVLKGIAAAASLKKLSLNDNKLESTLNFSGCDNLEGLEILHNSQKIKLEGNDDLVQLRDLSIDGNITVTGRFPFLRSLYVEKDYNLVCLQRNDENLLFNDRLTSLTINNCGFTHENFELIVKKFPYLSSIDLSNNLIHGSFSTLVEFLGNYGTHLKVFNIDNNPLASYIKSEPQISTYGDMITQVMRGNIE